jgi:ferredoxin-NADP reductase
MFDRALAPINRWALDHVDHRWVDYVVSNTMTDFNRWVNGFLWTYELKAQVLHAADEAPGVKTFVLRPNQHWRGMKAGQFIEVILKIGGQDVRRHYSPTVLPNGRLSITVKATENGVASRWLHQNVKRGMQIRLGRPQGRFCLEARPAQPGKVLFLCAGAGITPCHSIVTELLSRPAGERPDVQVMAQFRQAQDVLFKEDLRTRWPKSGVKVNLALSAATAGQTEAPRLDATQLRRLCTDVLEREIYLCGPAGFMASMIAELRVLGVDMARVHTERFSTAEAFSGSPDDFVVVGAEVYFQHLDTSITLTPQDQGQTLLQLARSRGIDVESGCCQGMCGTCRLTLHEGQASGNVLGKVVYLCTAYPASTRVVLDA